MLLRAVSKPIMPCPKQEDSSERIVKTRNSYNYGRHAIIVPFNERY